MTSNTLTLHAALDVFSDHLEDIKSACVDNMMSIITEEGKANWIREEITRLRIEPYKKVYQRITSKQQAILNPRTDSITDDMIARAKDFPIEELYDGKLRHGTGLCPFHQEKTPSFHIKKNRYKCYGCDVYGDSISFYMKMNNCNFIQAVKALQ